MRQLLGRAMSLALVTVCAASVAACGASESLDDRPAGRGEPSGTFPQSLDNCGERLTVHEAPTRVVSLDQGSTEILLSLGLADRIVGTASWTDPVKADLADENARVPRLADNAPSFEAVMATEPTLVTASFGRHLREKGGVASRERFATSGVPTYLSPADCDNGRSVNGGAKRTTPQTIDSVFREITELATLFDVRARGEALVASLRARVEKARSSVASSGASIGFWFADTRTPYFAAGLGSGNLLAQSVTARNVFADVRDDWPATTWESVVDRDPTVIVLGDLTRDRFPGDRLDDKKRFLATDPVTRTMPAVREQRYVALHGAEMNASIQLVDGIEKLAAGLARLPQR
ncbi:ABC transporter substrate-binding protein [Williamsia deligens]|uniref:ABC transporter substrate-binding protein n=1 Tax=Williamsia deligens TaxID=321325 RepID=A0ABW3GGY4_9NOCA|nr:ABC transporter substrate-binding protein [Williamsia deligens]MCP2195488.1 iron complex transport system substrate-binding protein [Williamsia deligens]